VHPVSPWGTPVSTNWWCYTLMHALTPARPKEVTRPDTRGTSIRSSSRTDPETRASADRDSRRDVFCVSILVAPFCTCTISAPCRQSRLLTIPQYTGLSMPRVFLSGEIECISAQVFFVLSEGCRVKSIRIVGMKRTAVPRSPAALICSDPVSSICRRTVGV
jgi:hypothetical protein